MSASASSVRQPAPLKVLAVAGFPARRSPVDRYGGTVDYRVLGRSGLMVSVLTMGTMTFGGKGGFAAIGSTDVEEGRRQVAVCLDAGVNPHL
jgi:hypothetical protein